MDLAIRLHLDDAKFRNLSKNLSTLPATVQGRLLMRAAKSAMKPVMADARSNAPVETGVLKNNLITKDKKYSTGVLVIAGAANKKDASTGRNPANYLHLVHDGVAPHTITGPCKIGNGWAQNIKHPGNKANPFLKNALEKNAPMAVLRFGRTLTSAIKREMKKI
jgi:HK97 gp10 family phage protein